MSNTLIQILRSYSTNTPASLQDGQLAYSFKSDKLFVGNTNNTVLTIGGKYYTDIIDTATAQATADKIVLRDNTGSFYANNITANVLNLVDISLSGNLSVTGTTSITSNVISNLNVSQNISANNLNVTNDTNIGNDLTVQRDLQVNRNLNVVGDFSVQGNTTTINSVTVTVDDKNLELGSMHGNTSPTDISSSGGGITLKGDTDKTFNWYMSSNSWTSSENLDIAVGKVYKIGENTILANTGLIAFESNFTVANTVATTVNAFGAASILNLGANTGTLTVRNPTLVGTESTQNIFDTTATTVNAFGAASTLNVGDNIGTITVRNPTLVGTESTQNVYNTVATTVNAFGAATSLNIGDSAGTLTLRNPTIVGSLTTQNLFNTVATTVNAFGEATSLNLGATTGTTNVRNSLTVTGDLNVDGGDITVTSGVLNLANTTATTVHAFGDAVDIVMGSGVGTATIRNPTLVGSDVTQNVYNTVATTVNAFGAATSIILGAGTGTTRVRNNLDVDVDLNIDGSNLTTTNTTFNLANTTAQTVHAFGSANVIHIGSSSGSTIVHNQLQVVANTLLSNVYVTGTTVLENALSVIYGGTGITSANTNGVLFGNGTGHFQVTAAGVEGNVLQVNPSNVPFFGMLDGGTF